MMSWLGQACRRVPRTLRRPVSVIGTTFQLYMQDSCSTYAAAIAYYAIFSIVPLSLITLSIFGLVVDQDRITDFVFEQVPLEESQSVRANVDEIVARAHDMSFASLGFGVLFLVWSSSGIFAAVRRGLNAATHLKQTRPYWHGKLIDIMLIPCLGLLILLSVGLTGATQFALERVSEWGPLDLSANRAIQVSSYFLPAVASFSLFALLYRYVPTARPAWSEALSGAVLATVLFELAKNAVAVLITFSGYSRDTAIYAGFGTALAFLLWMFVNASILLLGAEFGRAVRRPEGDSRLAAAPAPEGRRAPPDLTPALPSTLSHPQGGGPTPGS
jgi:membrane protein